jgi:hypothetical protein
MINWIKSWIRAVVREETNEAKENTLKGLKPGQTFTVMNTDGSFDQVTVKDAAKAKAPAKRKAKASSEKGRGA